MIYRNYFGTWGRELSDADFACALAGLGVLDRRPFRDIMIPVEDRRYDPADLVKPVEWTLSTPFFGGGAYPFSRVSAGELADSWKRSEVSGKVRLEVDRSSRFDGRVDAAAMLAWIVAELSRPDVGARSVYLRVDRPSVTVGWRWPIRVGFLADAESRELMERLRDHMLSKSWMHPLVSLVDAERSRSGCDLLLLPGDIRASLSLASGLPVPVRADCVIVLGRTEGDAARWYRMIEGLRAAVRTSGVAAVQRGTAEIEKWFVELVRGLSHNNPIDAALFGAADNRSQVPFIAISRRLAEFSRISMQLRRTAMKLERPGLRDVALEIEPDSPAARTLGLGAGRHTLKIVGERLEVAAAMGEAVVESGEFISELGAATGSARLRRSVEMATAAAAPSPVTQEERFIQASVFDLSDPAKPVRRTHRLRAGANHRVAVRIGARDEEWISSVEGGAFPVDSLPQDQDEWELTAVLSVAQSPDEPQMSRILLPRFGNSNEAAFFLFVKEEWKTVEARIIVLHRNRVIQTAMLEAQVGGSDDVGDGGNQITVEPEVVARTRFDNLGERQRFDAALVINKSKAGVDRILGLSDDKVARLTPGLPLNDEINTIDTILTEIVDDPKLFMGKLTSKSVVALLRRLAQHGNLLYDHLVSDGEMSKLGLDGDGPLQVISAVADARLPIEFVYSRRAPNDTARMCPSAAASLRKGKCASSCSKLAKQANFICPLAFWGVQRVIERHSPNPDLRKATAGSSFAVVSEPTDLRPTLNLLKGGLIAGTQRVDDTVTGGMAEICEVVGKLTSSSLKPVPNWTNWAKSIRKSGPSLLLLIVHTEETPTDSTIPRMQIGKASWLPLHHVEHKHVIRKNGQPPLVLLLGCETGVPDRQFANFVTRLRNKGAAIVVATGSKIHTMHAVPVAKEFVRRIQEAADKDGDATFGEVMLAVRREMLADGIPMVLTLNAFGDADWRLAKHS